MERRLYPYATSSRHLTLRQRLEAVMPSWTVVHSQTVLDLFLNE